MEAQEVLVEIEGMTCSTCALTVSKKLEETGATDIDVNFTTGETRFRKKSAGIPDEKFFSVVRSLGYRVRPLNQDRVSKGLNYRLWISLLLTLPLMAAMFFPGSILEHPLFQLALATPVFILGWMQFGKSAISSVRSGTSNMDVLILTGASSAYAYSVIALLTGINHHLFFETAASIIALVFAGNVLEQRTIRKTGSALQELRNLQPSVAIRLSMQFGKEVEESVRAADVLPGQRLKVRMGQQIPVDGKLLEGIMLVDESMLSGESLPVPKQVGDALFAGSVLIEGNGVMMAGQELKNSLISGMIDLVRKAQQNKPKIQRLGDRVSAVFVPVVMLISLGTFLVWNFALDAGLYKSIMTAVSVLVISCPCAMGLATPTAVMAGIGRGAKNGIFIRDGAVLEQLAGIRQIVFDKTGTLTDGHFVIHALNNFSSFSDDQIRATIVRMAAAGSHPISEALRSIRQEGSGLSIQNCSEMKGRGLVADSEIGTIFLGSAAWMREKHSSNVPESGDVFLFTQDQLLASISLADSLLPSAGLCIQMLKQRGMKPFLVSGDHGQKVKTAADTLGIEHYNASVLPGEKVSRIEELQKSGGVIMVGDGVNDAPALAAANVGIAVGRGSAAAMQSAGVVISPAAGLLKIPEALALASKTKQTIYQNLFFSLVYNILAIPLAAAGMLHPMIGVLAMSLSDLCVIGNSILLKYKTIH